MELLCGEEGVKVEALLDTGAEVSVVERSIVEQGGWEIVASGIRTLEGIAQGAAKVYVLGEVTMGVWRRCGRRSHGTGSGATTGRVSSVADRIGCVGDQPVECGVDGGRLQGDGGTCGSGDGV